jgi:putative sterol carrier protein
MMAFPFPSTDWMEALIHLLNHDERYDQVAKNWEGDILVVINPDETGGDLVEPVAYYLDLWHGACRSGSYFESLSEINFEAAFVMRATITNILKIFSGELDPIQAMLTRRLQVEGNMGYILRNVPTVLDFVRCCRLVAICAP